MRSNAELRSVKSELQIFMSPRFMKMAEMSPSVTTRLVKPVRLALDRPLAIRKACEHPIIKPDFPEHPYVSHPDNIITGGRIQYNIVFTAPNNEFHEFLSAGTLEHIIDICVVNQVCEERSEARIKPLARLLLDK